RNAALLRDGRERVYGLFQPVLEQSSSNQGGSIRYGGLRGRQYCTNETTYGQTCIVRRKLDRHFPISRQYLDALFVKYAPIFILLGSIPLSSAYGTRLALCRSVRGTAGQGEK